MASQRGRLKRFTLIETPSSGGAIDFARDVRSGLTATPKHLHFAYFYDEAGSQLFEEICALPEYYLTRAEAEILERVAPWLAAVADGSDDVDLVELGSGSSRKTRILIAALLGSQATLRYLPIDISQSILEQSARSLLADFPRLEVVAVAAEYRTALARLHAEPGRRKLILWLGSNVGNFHRGDGAAFLGEVRRTMASTDRMLVGIDLRKERGELERAYDDTRGVTARFNLNLLHRINEELGGDFDLRHFHHCARYDEDLGRVEMHLVSDRAQRVAVRGLGEVIEFREGETIHTENSYKYSVAEIATLASDGGFTVEETWFDEARRFSLNLLSPR